MGKKFVLDSSVFINSSSVSFPSPITTPGVMREVRDVASKGLLLVMREKGLRITSPSPVFIERVKKIASSRLSKVDVEVLALALEEKAVVVTDDYRMQNAAKKLGLEFESIIRGSMRKKKSRS